MDILSKRIDNSALVLFRMFFGGLMAWQSFEYLLNGWVTRNLVSPRFTFSHIGLEWLQPLPGSGMYWYFAIMGMAAVFVAAGFRYRWSVIALTVLWAGVYFMQKSVYNNHFYLLMLTGILLTFLPAGNYASVDGMISGKKKLSMPAWCAWVMILQMTIVYVFASVAKMYPGWISGTFPGIVLSRYAHIPGLSFFADSWFHQVVAWSGILFDLLVIPMFLYKRTRLLALLASLAFHAFNFLTLKIGIFPFFALSFAVFFFDPEALRRIFFRQKPMLTPNVAASEATGNNTVLLAFFLPYFLIQLILPMRHWFIPGDVLFTEEGHRLSWRMMLRHRTGWVNFRVVDASSGKPLAYDTGAQLTKRQLKTMQTHPDMIWQMARRIHSDFLGKGIRVKVYVDAFCSVNREPAKQLIDPSVDLAATDFFYFEHSPWIRKD
ncbi:MAG: hypothetical protein EOO01_16425 [Chitinophagaceae bacterium]|nr:MAG: hypothetical protein EOO01_16425 [Chitinophagaceae bacterium]